MSSQVYVFAWGNNPRRVELRGRLCVIEARGTMRTVLVRLLDTGERVTTSVRALRKWFPPEIAICGENGGGGNRTRVSVHTDTCDLQADSVSSAADEPRPGLCNTLRRALVGLLSLCSTAVVWLSAAALTPDQEAVIRYLAVTVAALAVAVLLVPAGRALSRAYAVASAYSREDSGPRNGCDGSPLHDADLTVATFLVPCGARIRICLGRRCVIAVRKDSGPYAAGRQLDLNLGVVRALGFPSCAAFGVRTVTWRRA